MSDSTTKVKNIYTRMDKVIEYLGSAAFGVKLLIGTVIVQGFHSYYVFYNLSSYTSELPIIISSTFYSTVLSAAILFFTMRKKYRVAYVFAFFESGVNLYYFAISLFAANKLEGLIIAIPISFFLPYTIYNYAFAINQAIEEILTNTGISQLSQYSKIKMKEEIMESVKALIPKQLEELTKKKRE